MSNRLTERAADFATVIAAVAAVVVATLAVRDRAASKEIPVRQRVDSVVLSPQIVTEVHSAGHRRGSTRTGVTIVEFVDYECSVCARFESTARAVLERANVSMLYRHYPLSNHRFAKPAARAVECAAAQGKFAEMHKVLFETQDSLGLIPFASLAERAGVRSATMFDQCTRDPRIDSLIERDRTLAISAGITGTPAFVIGRVLYSGILTEPRLREILGQVAPP